jgi:hypothetical protein
MWRSFALRFRFSVVSAGARSRRCKDGRLAALNRLDVVNAAAIPLRAEPAATRCGEMVE